MYLFICIYSPHPKWGSCFSWTPPEQEHRTQEPTYHLPPTRVVVIVGVVKVALVIVAVMIVVVMVVIVVIFVW